MDTCAANSGEKMDAQIDHSASVRFNGYFLDLFIDNTQS